MKSHRVLYAVTAGVLAVLLVIMLITYNYNRYSPEALAKAEQLIAAFDEAGLRTPANPENVARVFGTEGGTVCAEADGNVAAGIAKLNLAVGGAFYTRPVLADRRVAAGLLLVVETYCPEKLDQYREFFDSQRFVVLVNG